MLWIGVAPGRDDHTRRGPDVRHNESPGRQRCPDANRGHRKFFRPECRRRGLTTVLITRNHSLGDLYHPAEKLQKN
jgi:hypothetical protein